VRQKSKKVCGRRRGGIEVSERRLKENKKSRG
jgi:hypothetical protein